MSLLGFKSTNHPLQVKKFGANDRVDERITPDWLFQTLNERFSFTLDAAANAANTKCKEFFDRETDGLAQSWSGHSVWCNPPFSNLAAWVAKAWSEYRSGAHIVMLLPSNRTEQPWWQEQIEPFRDGKGPLKTEFLPRRINFGAPDNADAKYKSSAQFGLVLVIFGIPAPVRDVVGSEPHQRILGILDDYAGLQPEEGEDWESWYRAAFDLARERIRAALSTATPEKQP